MEETNSAGSAKFGFSKPNTAETNQKDNTQSPVEETPNTEFTQDTKEDNNSHNLEYTDERTISISLVKNFSLYRRANDKVLPKKKDYIGGSVSASRILSSNKDEVEAYFPTIIGLSVNDKDFVMRVKQYLNNIRIGVDEMGITFNISFVYHRKADYFEVVRREEEIEAQYRKANHQDLSKLKEAIKDKITKINILESGKHKIGYPVNVDEYLMYRHCLLYADIAKDIKLINSDPSIRFYFKDDQKEAEKLRKYRTEVNKAKANYVACLADDVLFESIYTRYLVLNNLPVVAGLLETSLDKEIKLDKFSAENAVKFNEMFNNKDSKLIGSIELLIAHGELQRSQFNQNISTSDGQFIGANITDAVAWFKQPDNKSVVDTFFNKLKNI